jgi:hypothetical protein
MGEGGTGSRLVFTTRPLSLRQRCEVKAVPSLARE